MKNTFAREMIVAAVLFLPLAILHAQSPSPVSDLTSLKFLVGNWTGEGSAETGQVGDGYCSFELGLQGKVLIRKNHSEYPAAKDHPAITHDDLMIIYPDNANKQIRAFYTDNEGHVINYVASTASDGKSAVFLSESDSAHPRYRLTYTLTRPDRMSIAFEMAPAATPDQFQKFISGSLRRAAN